jgi:hypothetical protein
LSGDPGTGNSYAFTVMRNGVATAITCTVSGNSTTTCSNVVNTQSFTAGDTISLQSVPASSPTARSVSWSVKLQ